MSAAYAACNVPYDPCLGVWALLYCLFPLHSFVWASYVRQAPGFSTSWGPAGLCLYNKRNKWRNIVLASALDMRCWAAWKAAAGKICQLNEGALEWIWLLLTWISLKRGYVYGGGNQSSTSRSLASVHNWLLSLLVLSNAFRDYGVMVIWWKMQSWIKPG